MLHTRNRSGILVAFGAVVILKYIVFFSVLINGLYFIKVSK